MTMTQRPSAANVSVAQCGVSIAWDDGLLVDKISRGLRRGCHVNVHAQHVERHFVCWTCVV